MDSLLIIKPIEFVRGGTNDVYEAITATLKQRDIAFETLEVKNYRFYNCINQTLRNIFDIKKYECVISINSPFLCLGKFNLCYIFREPYYNFISTSRTTLYNLPTCIFFKLLPYIYNNKNNHFLVLSSHMQKCVFDLWGKKFPILYPPIDLSKYCSDRKKKNIVISLGRFEDAKNQLSQLKLAEHFPEIEFRIVGSKYFEDYYQKCIYFKDKKKLDNVTFYTNVSDDQKIKLLSESKFYINTEKITDWSISAVEALASGCIPLVPNNDAMPEIVPLRKLRYDTEKEMIDKMSQILYNDGRYNTDLEFLKMHINKFSIENFKKEFDKSLIDLAKK